MKFGVLVRKKDGSPSFGNWKQVGKFWGALNDSEIEKVVKDFNLSYEVKGNDVHISKGDETLVYSGANK